jgi:type II secretory pathway pseudopilin PulG
LAELLVVVSIIVILVAMLAPFLGGMNERALQTLCQNNLHKIGQAMSTAASNSGGRIPTGDSWLLPVRQYGSTEILTARRVPTAAAARTSS